MAMQTSILFHLDPMDEYEIMCSHRTNFYIELAKKINKPNVDLIYYGREKYANIARQSGVFNRVIPSKLPTFNWPSYGIYHTMAFGNNLPMHVENCVLREYAAVNIKANAVVTNTPSALVKRAFPESEILHYELGYFNRKPFPVLHQLDPWGYSFKSLLANYPNIKSYVKTEEQIVLTRLKDWILANTGLQNKHIANDDAVFFPLQSGTTWMVKLETGLSRIQQIEYVARRFPDRLIKISEKKDYPLLPSELEKIQKIPNLHLLSGGDPLCEGSYMVAKCQDVFTMSPSLALQTLFWGNKLHCLPGTSMSAWTRIDRDSSGILASYHSDFILGENFDLVERIKHQSTRWN